MIANCDFVAFPLRGTTPETHLRRSINIKFVMGLGEDYGADVPPFYDQVVVPRTLMQLLSNNLADQRQLANAGNTFVHTIVAQMLHRIDIIDQDARLAVLKAAGNAR